MNNYKKIKNILIKYGAKNIEYYELINNWGYGFELFNKKYDLRYWANCYGVAVCRFGLQQFSNATEEEQNTLKKLVNECNELADLFY